MNPSNGDSAFAPLVVVGIDFSEPSARAVAEARELARAMGARLEAVHVSEVGDAEGGAGDAPSRAGEGARSEWLEACRLGGSPVHVRRGTAWVELARHAAERDALLIVVGTHGRGGFQPVSLGSTAQRLAVASTRPVLVVGRRGPPRTAAAAV